MEIKNIVKVRYLNEFMEFSGREYTYFADQDLAVGDIVKVPTKFGTSTAKVSQINVSEKEVAPIASLMRTIPEQEITRENLKTETKEEVAALWN